MGKAYEVESISSANLAFEDAVVGNGLADE
jgi:hypothetical protein